MYILLFSSIPSLLSLLNNSWTVCSLLSISSMYSSEDILPMPAFAVFLPLVLPLSILAASYISSDDPYRISVVLESPSCCWCC